MMKQASTSKNMSAISATTAMFSSAVVKELSKGGSSAKFARLLNISDICSELSPEATVADAFEKAFKQIRHAQFRNEYVYKAAIAEKILLGIHSAKSATMLTEFRVGKCKADVVVLNGTATAYEIKSERDSLERLPDQISAYRRVFAAVNVIVAAKHLEQVEKIVPSDVGIMVLSPRYQISTYRNAVEDMDRVEPSLMLSSIRLSEAKAILRCLGREVPKVPNTQIYRAIGAIFEDLEPQELHRMMVKVLKKSRSLCTISKFLDEIPKPLLAAAISTNIGKTDFPKLVAACGTSIADAQRWN